MHRRTFIHQFGLGAIALGTGIPQLDFSGHFSLSILHTNDLHGRFLEKTSSGNLFAQQAAAMLQKVRATQANVLLLDAGDVLHPSQSVAQELAWMQQMGYEAMALGNHDFDRGMPSLAQQIQQSSVPVLAANYKLEGTPLAQQVKPYQVVQKGGQRIGIIGVGVNPQGLIPQVLREGLEYQDPVQTVNHIAAQLKEQEQCSLIICLSHLGYQYKDQQVSDVSLAALSRNVDIIIGGHTHTFLPEPVVVNNLDGKPVVINHAGWGGLLMGRIDLEYRDGAIRVVKGENVSVGASSFSYAQ